ncbi:MAG: hypothetical protein ACXWDN_03660 [Limisphaerales bacterium]
MKKFSGWKIIAALGLIFSTLGLKAQSLQTANASFAWVNCLSGAVGNMPNFGFDTNGNCYAVCHFHSTNAVINGITVTNTGTGWDTLVIKYNNQGQIQWFKHATGTASDIGLAVAVDPAGPVYVMGAFYSPVMTLDGFSVTNSTGTSSSDIFVAKLDTNGNVQWLRWGGSSGLDTCYHAVVDHDGNLLITGTFPTTSMKFDTTTLNAATANNLFLIKIDPSGHVIWAQAGGGANGAAGYRMTADASNNYYVTGPFSGTVSFGGHTLVSNGKHDVFVAKYDSTGNNLWAINGGGTGDEEGFGIGVDPSGNCYVSGFFASTSATFGSTTLQAAGNNDIFLAKVSSSGSFIWARAAGGTGQDLGQPVAFDSEGNVFLGCHYSTNGTFGSVTVTNAGAEDMAVAKYDPDGNLKWVIRAGGNTDDEPNHIAFDQSGHLFLSGYCSSNCVFGNLTANNTVTNGIYLARLDFPLPQLGIGYTNSEPVLTWGTNSAYAVTAQSTTNVVGPWNDVTNVPVLVNGSEVITNLSPTNTAFYRLRKAN